MPVVSRTAKLVYFPVPKVACTSAKLAMWEVEHGSMGKRARLALRRAGHKLGMARKLPGIHHRIGFETAPFPQDFQAPNGFETVAIVRDPLQRLRSAWSNKVDAAALRRWNEYDAVIAAGLPAEPDFRTFIRNFDAYTSLSRAAREHTRPHAYYLGPDISVIDHLIPFERIDRFFELLSSRTGHEVRPIRENASSARNRDPAITVNEVDQLRRITAEDYAYLAGFYDFDEGLAAIMSA